jgi:hypothetical protein
MLLLDGRKRSKTMASVRASGLRWAAVLLTAIAVALVGVLATQIPASAHDHRVPKTVLMKGKQELQTGRKVNEYSWTYPAGEGICATEQAILTFGFPNQVPSVAADSTLKVRIHKSQKPSPFYVAEVDQSGGQRGEVNVRLKPVVRDERTVAWDAVFRVKRPNSDYYLEAEGHWRDRQGCNDADQYALWTFHVKTRSAL